MRSKILRISGTDEASKDDSSRRPSGSDMGAAELGNANATVGRGNDLRLKAGQEAVILEDKERCGSKDCSSHAYRGPPIIQQD